MNSLRLEADQSNAKVEELQAKVKTLEQDNLAKEQEITSLQHKNRVLEDDVEKFDNTIKDLKKSAAEGDERGTQNESLQRKVQLLEEEAEAADRALRETNEKYVLSAFFFPYTKQTRSTANIRRLRLTDVKAGHFERKVQALENERDQWEAKYEEMAKKYADIVKQLEEFQVEMNSI